MLHGADDLMIKDLVKSRDQAKETYRATLAELAKLEGKLPDQVADLPVRDLLQVSSFSRQAHTGAMEFVRQIAHKVTVLHEGMLLCEGSMEEVQNDARVIEKYLGRGK